MKKLSAIFIAFTLIFSYSVLTDIANSEESQYEYIGLKRCKMCHNSSKSGKQYAQWESSAHSKAYETLASAEAKKIAKEKGIEDPQKDGKCLKCHVTGYGVDEKFYGNGYKMEDGVTCEACHGAGEKYWKRGTMIDLSKGTVKPESVGLVIPNKDLCVTCHNEESPTYKEFNYDEMIKKVSHPIPDDYKKKKGYK